MTPLQYLKMIIRTLPKMSKQSGYPAIFLGRIFAQYYFMYGIELEEFQTLRLYNYSSKRMAEYLTWKNSKKISDELNSGATADEIALFNDKHLFNTHFHSLIHRDWLYIPDSTPEDIRAFLARNDTFLAKACISTQGKNIFRYTASELDPDRFIDEYSGKPFLLESFIEQHPVLAAINPSSVNTIRLIVARSGDQVAFIGAGLRSGGSGQFVDNFHHGGTAYPLDLETGTITAQGIDLDGNPVLSHPVTGYIMPGLQIPHWDLLLNQVRKASVMTEHIGYIGWDLAIDENSDINLIEFNCLFGPNQENCGPTFGDMTEEVLSEVFAKKKLKR